MDSKKRAILLLCVVFSLLFVFFFDSSSAQPGFVSLDCGGNASYTDKIGLAWIPDSPTFGETVKISVPNETRSQYLNVRYFPNDSRKYCYTLNVTTNRYLVRVSFLYGNFDNNLAYPVFDVSLGATRWDTIVITDPNVIETRELIFLASSPTVSVCLYNATIGRPFISTLELRQFNGSIYYTAVEKEFYLTVSARINFGADSEAPVRYPDDVFDRLWESDLLEKANYLVEVAAGTEKVSTSMPIEASMNEMPPQNVMRTGVVGTNGSLTYRLNLDGFPGSGWAVTYFSEIEDLAENESREFRLMLPGNDDISKSIINIEENAHGKYRLYEPGFPNLSLPFVFSFEFRATPDSSRGPLVNAIEINKYLRKTEGSVDGPVLANMVSRYSSDWALEGGDPCLPVPWSWIRCNSDSPPRIVLIKLSSKNMTGSIPTELTKFIGLRHLWLDGNSLTGPIPDFTGCDDLRILHLENNQLTGEFPSSLAKLPNLKELYVQNNMLTGTVPRGLLSKDLALNFSGNVNLREETSSRTGTVVIICSVVGVFAVIVGAWFLYTRSKKVHDAAQREVPIPVQNPSNEVPIPVQNPSNEVPIPVQNPSNEVPIPVQNPNNEVPIPVQNPKSSQSDLQTETAHCYSFHEIQEATKNFKKKIGSGEFWVVYYGKMRDGKEIAVKDLARDSGLGKRDFTNEVTILSMLHHRNLVRLHGYYQDNSRSMLIYEFMHNGTLKEHLCARGRTINWIKRLEIAKDSAKGIKYLHKGCSPAIIHRDLKSSNILLDKNMRAKVADFGLPKLAVEGVSHVSSAVQGTVGYLDPEYYSSQQLTDKSDVYSFGVILLELISGQQATSNEKFGVDCHSIVEWAKLHMEHGNIQDIIDPALGNEYNIHSLWQIAEIALMCVQSEGYKRPSISEVLKEVQEAIYLEQNSATIRDGNPDMSRYPSGVDDLARQLFFDGPDALPKAR